MHIFMEVDHGVGKFGLTISLNPSDRQDLPFVNFKIYVRYQGTAHFICNIEFRNFDNNRIVMVDRLFLSKVDGASYH